MKAKDAILIILLGAAASVLGQIVYDRIRARKPLRVLNFPATTTV